jgi:hypothetical protein
MRQASLPAGHYTMSWPIDKLQPVTEISALGQRYAELPAEVLQGNLLVSNPVKQDLLLELCKCFHPYLMKYLVMICHGHMPVWGNQVNKDILQFIQYFLPKGSKLNKQTIQEAIRHLHLAFKGMETEEIYDVLMSQLIRAIAKYDPKYTEKVRLVVEAIDGKLSDSKQLRLAELNKYVDFDCDRYIRLLCRRGFLTPVTGPEKSKPATVRSR